MLREMYRWPLGETPKRSPGIPQLKPTPRLESVQRKGPLPNTLRNLHPIVRLTVVEGSVPVGGSEET
jgi:hypothetical protein